MRVDLVNGRMYRTAPALAQRAEERLDALQPQQKGLWTREILVDLPLVVRTFKSYHDSSPSLAKFAVRTTPSAR